jgi:hypothetical protein
MCVVFKQSIRYLLYSFDLIVGVMSPSRGSKQYSGTFCISLKDKPFLLTFLLLYGLYVLCGLCVFYGLCFDMSSDGTLSFLVIVVLCSVAGAADAVLDVEGDL